MLLLQDKLVFLKKEEEMKENIMQRAASTVGGSAALARKIGISPQAVQQWCKAGKPPANRVLNVEHITGVPRYELRPDIYPKEAA